MALNAAQTWLKRFAVEILGRVHNDAVRTELRMCAGAAMELHRHGDLGPIDAARLWARDFA